MTGYGSRPENHLLGRGRGIRDAAHKQRCQQARRIDDPARLRTHLATALLLELHQIKSLTFIESANAVSTATLVVASVRACSSAYPDTPVGAVNVVPYPGIEENRERIPALRIASNTATPITSSADPLRAQVERLTDSAPDRPDERQHRRKGRPPPSKASRPDKRSTGGCNDNPIPTAATTTEWSPVAEEAVPHCETYGAQMSGRRTFSFQWEMTNPAVESRVSGVEWREGRGRENVPTSR